MRQPIQYNTKQARTFFMRKNQERRNTEEKKKPSKQSTKKEEEKKKHHVRSSRSGWRYDQHTHVPPAIAGGHGK